MYCHSLGKLLLEINSSVEKRNTVEKIYFVLWKMTDSGEYYCYGPRSTRSGVYIF